MNVKLIIKPEIKYSLLHAAKLSIIDAKGATLGAVVSVYNKSNWKHFYYGFNVELESETAYLIATTTELKLTTDWNGILETGILSGNIDQYLNAMFSLCTTSQNKIMRAVFNTINAYLEEDKILLPLNKIDAGDGTYAVIPGR